MTANKQSRLIAFSVVLILVFSGGYSLWKSIQNRNNFADNGIDTMGQVFCINNKHNLGHHLNKMCYKYIAGDTLFSVARYGSISKNVSVGGVYLVQYLKSDAGESQILFDINYRKLLGGSTSVSLEDYSVKVGGCSCIEQ